VVQRPTIKSTGRQRLQQDASRRVLPSARGTVRTPCGDLLTARVAGEEVDEPEGCAVAEQEFPDLVRLRGGDRATREECFFVGGERRFSSLWQIRHLSANNMRIPPLRVRTYKGCRFPSNMAQFPSS